MKKTLFVTLMTFAAMTIVNQRALFVKAAEAFVSPADANRAAAAAHLPAGLTVPEILPSGIQDPILLEAWIRLYNHEEAIQLWDGSTLTGGQLAQYALDHNLPIVWDTGKVCSGGSCSLRYLVNGVYVFDDGLGNGIKPIYLAPIEDPHGTNMQFLVGTLAHEIFHRRSPFGAVSDTKFEEYWAFRIGATIGKNAAPNFNGIDPMISGELFIWLLKNKMSFYYGLPEYPASVAALVASHLVLARQ
jgi:hypothetical protein